MSTKVLFASLLSLLMCAGALATEVATISFNFYSGGEIVLEGKAPEGVTICPKIRFHNPKLFGYAFPLEVNLEKTKSVELTFKVKGGSGKMEASVNCRAFKGKKKLILQLKGSQVRGIPSYSGEGQHLFCSGL